MCFSVLILVPFGQTIRHSFGSTSYIVWRLHRNPVVTHRQLHTLKQTTLWKFALQLSGPPLTTYGHAVGMLWTCDLADTGALMPLNGNSTGSQTGGYAATR